MRVLIAYLPFLLLCTSCVDPNQEVSRTALALLIVAAFPLTLLVVLVVKFNRDPEELVYTDDDLEALKYWAIVEGKITAETEEREVLEHLESSVIRKFFKKINRKLRTDKEGNEITLKEKIFIVARIIKTKVVVVYLFVFLKIKAVYVRYFMSDNEEEILTEESPTKEDIPQEEGFPLRVFRAEEENSESVTTEQEEITKNKREIVFKIREKMNRLKIKIIEMWNILGQKVVGLKCRIKVFCQNISKKIEEFDFKSKINVLLNKIRSFVGKEVQTRNEDYDGFVEKATENLLVNIPSRLLTNTLDLPEEEIGIDDEINEYLELLDEE